MADQSNNSNIPAGQAQSASGRPSLAHIPSIDVGPAPAPKSAGSAPASQGAAPSSRVMAAVQAQKTRDVEGKRKAQRAERSEARAHDLGIDTRKSAGRKPRPRSAEQGSAAPRKAPGGGAAASEARPNRSSVSRTSASRGFSFHPGPVGIAVMMFLAIMAVIFAVFSVSHFVLVDDAARIQGTWVGKDKTRAVVITDSQINLDGQATYDYTLDTGAKSISTSFQDLSGTAHYRFSRDGKKLAIMDTSEPDAVKAYFSDFSWTVMDLIYSAQGKKHSPLTGEGVVLKRASKKQIAAFEAKAKLREMNGKEGEEGEDQGEYGE